MPHTLDYAHMKRITPNSLASTCARFLGACARFVDSANNLGKWGRIQRMKLPNQHVGYCFSTSCWGDEYGYSIPVIMPDAAILN